MWGNNLPHTHLNEDFINLLEIVLFILFETIVKIVGVVVEKPVRLGVFSTGHIFKIQFQKKLKKGEGIFYKRQYTGFH